MSEINVFISYSHSDSRWFDSGSLIPRLTKSLEVSEGVKVWYDKKRLVAGDAWQREIEEAIDQSQIAILLISQDFLISDFIRNTELLLIERRAEKGELIIIPILVGYCDWQTIPSLSKPQMIPGGPTPLVKFLGKPDEWDQVQYEILTQVQQQIRKIRDGSVAPSALTHPTQGAASEPDDLTKNKVILLDREGAALFRKAEDDLSKGNKESGYMAWKEAIALYEQILALDPRVAVTGTVLIATKCVELAEKLMREDQLQYRQEAKALAQKAVPLLNVDKSVGADLSGICAGYSTRAKSIIEKVDGGSAKTTKWSMDEAFNNISKLEPITRLDSLSPQERIKALADLAAVGWDQIFVDIEYLDKNLSKDDSRRTGLTALSNIVRNMKEGTQQEKIQ